MLEIGVRYKHVREQKSSGNRVHQRLFFSSLYNQPRALDQSR